MTENRPADDRVTRAVLDCLRDGSWARYDHERLESFEAFTARTLGAAHAVLAGSGTLALEHALAATGVGPGGMVALSAYDFPGNFLTVHALGARPVLVDADPATGQMDPASLSVALGRFSIAAVVVSHLHGGIAPLDDIIPLCDRAGAAVVEDCCQCPGGTLAGRPLGTRGRAGVVSFGGGKPVSCGRGGAVLTDDALVAQRVKLRSHRGTRLAVPGNLQLAALEPQLAGWKETLGTAADRLGRLDGVFRNNRACQPVWRVSTGNLSGFYRLGLMVPAGDRQRLIESAKALDLPLAAGFRAIHAGRSAARFETAGDLPGALECGRRMTTLEGELVRWDGNAFEDALERCRAWAPAA